MPIKLAELTERVRSLKLSNERKKLILTKIANIIKTANKGWGDAWAHAMATPITGTIGRAAYDDDYSSPQPGTSVPRTNNQRPNGWPMSESEIRQRAAEAYRSGQNPFQAVRHERNTRLGLPKEFDLADLEGLPANANLSYFTTNRPDYPAQLPHHEGHQTTFAGQTADERARLAVGRRTGLNPTGGAVPSAQVSRDEIMNMAGVQPLPTPAPAAIPSDDTTQGRLAATPAQLDRTISTVPTPRAIPNVPMRPDQVVPRSDRAIPSPKPSTVSRYLPEARDTNHLMSTSGPVSSAQVGTPDSAVGGSRIRPLGTSTPPRRPTYDARNTTARSDSLLDDIEEFLDKPASIIKNTGEKVMTEKSKLTKKAAIGVLKRVKLTSQQRELVFTKLAKLIKK